MIDRLPNAMAAACEPAAPPAVGASPEFVSALYAANATLAAEIDRLTRVASTARTDSDQLRAGLREVLNYEHALHRPSRAAFDRWRRLTEVAGSSVPTAPAAICTDRFNAVRDSAMGLVKSAETLGVVLTIEQEPLQPLAMGNYRTTVAVRPARGMA